MIGREIVIEEVVEIGQPNKRILLRVMDIILVTDRNDYKGGMANMTAYLCKDSTQSGNVKIVKPSQIREIR